MRHLAAIHSTVEAGTNTLDFSNAGSGLTFNLGSGTATGWGTDSFSNFAQFIGSNNGDHDYWQRR